MIHRMEDIPKLSDEKLEELLDTGELEQRGYQLAFREYKRRKLKTHWTLIPSFWVAFFAMIFAAVAVYFSYLAIPLEQRPFRVNRKSPTKSASEQQQQSQSIQPSLPKAKTSVSSSLPSESPKPNQPTGADAKSAAH
jgi:hypothetical protein